MKKRKKAPTPRPEATIQIKGRHGLFDRFAGVVTRLAGSPYAFSAAVVVVLLWAFSGPLFGFSETWQLVINTARRS